MKWEIVNLVDVCDFQGGTQPPKSEWLNEKRGGYVRMIQIRDFTQGKEGFVEYVKDSKTLKKCRVDDIMIGRYGASIGKILSGLEGAYNVALVKTIPSAKLNRNYFYHYLNAPYFQNFIQTATSRAAQAGFNKEELRELKIPLPPLPIQQKIAAILDEADALRRKDKALLAKYDELLQAVFYDLFGDPVKNDKGWEVKKLHELINLSEKITYGVVQPGDDYPNGVPVIRVGDFENMLINQQKMKRISPEIESAYKRTRLQGDEILIACVGSIGKIALVDDSCRGYNIVRATARVRLDIQKANRYFVGFSLSTKAIQDYFTKETRTVSQPTLNISHIESTPILYPPMELQNAFAEIAINIQHQKSQIIQQQSYSENLFQSLMQRAFKGELVG